ncbi:MAG: group II intron reverse transcriptase/maturase [Coleofasciculus sp. C3-bin4]|nr:group II intron reverse transcriptase/maturase [Coleofasciculus sp. C3-bin4]
MSLANGTKTPTQWACVNWRKANRAVKNLRYRIFRATTQGDYKKVRSLQKLMLRSYSNRLLSVRIVTQINRGKRTAGIDQQLATTPEEKGKLVETLATFQPWQVKPSRRVYIPKTNGKLRPLGISTITDRCMQRVVKTALEPEWEAKLEASCYGFRPGRSCHDAIQKLYFMALPKNRKHWAVDADLQGCFDNINQSFLMDTVGQFPARELIRQWLKAGYVESRQWHSTEAGVPQGNGIAPLLANIALHGMEEALEVRYNNRGQLCGKRGLVKYADDFVVMCETREDAEAAVETLIPWLQERGLTFSQEKTRIVHLQEGLDFLGFNFRHYYTPKQTKTGWKLLTKPSPKSIAAIKSKLKAEWLALRGRPVQEVIMRLNPIIRGWANYFRIGVASRTFRDLDAWMFQRQRLYAKKLHPNKSPHWWFKQYWGRLNLERYDNWVFGNKATGEHLLKFTWVSIERHIMVKGRASLDDPSLKEYWHIRAKAIARELTVSRRTLARKQGYRCPICGESLFNGEALHAHHKVPKALGGKDSLGNLLLLHAVCHQQIHSGGSS